MGWNFNMEEAPRGETKLVTKTIGKNKVEVEEYKPVEILAAGSDLVVTVTRWNPKEGRWNMFSKATPPIAWQPYPTHPSAP